MKLAGFLTALACSIALVPVPACARAAQVSESDVIRLALNVYHEPRNQPLLGQFAVAHVTLNRPRVALAPRSICDIVYQKGSFSWTDRHRNVEEPPVYDAAWKIAQWITRDVVAGRGDNPINESIFFHAASVEPYGANAGSGEADRRSHILSAPASSP